MLANCAVWRSDLHLVQVHAAVGDASVDPSAWEMHSNDITYLSTCSCGRRQAVRRDPFTLKVPLFSVDTGEH